MKKKWNLISSFIFSLSVLFFPLASFSQGSADSRICNCFDVPVAGDFMKSTKAVYGRIGVVLSPGIELKPEQSQPVKFTVPVLKSKSGCISSYNIYITDSLNSKVYDKTSTENEISYAFPGCGKTYHVTLVAFSKSASGGDGNCSRRINFTVKTQCLTRKYLFKKELNL